ncbi:MAG: hypothetical protein ACYCPS_06760 [Candidatus Saccharimonadales bacterium]
MKHLPRKTGNQKIGQKERPPLLPICATYLPSHAVVPTSEVIRDDEPDIALRLTCVGLNSSSAAY